MRSGDVGPRAPSAFRFSFQRLAGTIKRVPAAYTRFRAIDARTKVCEFVASTFGAASVTREALLRELRKAARTAGVEFQVVPDRGKGSHYRVRFGEHETTIKSGELRPGYVRLIKAQLGVR